jgi:hypothetical protein
MVPVPKITATSYIKDKGKRIKDENRKAVLSVRPGSDKGILKGKDES